MECLAFLEIAKSLADERVLSLYLKEKHLIEIRIFFLILIIFIVFPNSIIYSFHFRLGRKPLNLNIEIFLIENPVMVFRTTALRFISTCLSLLEQPMSH